MNEIGLKTSDIARALDKSQQTIQRYARLGAEYLSEGARTGEETKFFTLPDTTVITYISTMKDRRVGDAEILAALANGERGQAIDNTSDEITQYATQQNALLVQIDSLQAQLAEYQGKAAASDEYRVQRDMLEGQVEKLEAQLKEARQEIQDAYERGFDKGFTKGIGQDGQAEE